MSQEALRECPERVSSFNYLERNARVIAEMRNGPVFTRGLVVGSSQKTNVVSIGSYTSESFSRPLYVVLKEQWQDRGLDPELNAVYNLAAIAGIAQHIPELVPELPLFSGLLKDRYGKPIGTITEDLSQGGRYRIFDVFADLLHYEGQLIDKLRSFLSSPRFTISDEELARMFFTIDTGGNHSVRRLGDLDHAMQCLTIDQRTEKFPIDLVMADIAKHTLTLDYDF